MEGELSNCEFRQSAEVEESIGMSISIEHSQPMIQPCLSGDMTAGISQREQLWDQQRKLLTEQNHALQLNLAEKESQWELEKSELLRRIEESERKLHIQHRALSERCEVLMAALEAKYTEDRVRDRDNTESALRGQSVPDSDRANCERVNINIGGKVFATTVDTLRRNDFRFERWPIHADGCYFVDRDPQYFSFVMAYMRTGHLDAEHLTHKQRRRLRAEFLFYQLPMPLLRQPFQWSAECIGAGLTLANNNLTVTTKAKDNIWRGVIGSLPVDSFTVRVEDRGSMGLLMIGFGKRENFRANDPNFKFSGWFIYVTDGSLWSPEESVQSKPFLPAGIGDGALVTATFNRASHSISFHVDNAAPAVAFACAGLSELDDLYPVIDICDVPVTLSAVHRT